MADIFMSHAREDEACIHPLIRAFTDQGWSVFWDRRIPAGKSWADYLGKTLGNASCVVVAWSRHSIAAEWVREEADEGKKCRILVPVLLDAIEPPIGFRGIQAANLTEWQPGRNSPHFEQLLHDIQTVLGAAPRSPTSEPPYKPTLISSKVFWRLLAPTIVAATLVLVVMQRYLVKGFYIVQ